MNYPSEVQEYINVLGEYKLNEALDTFHILHMYAKGLAYPSGYYDSQFFDLVAYNTELMEYRLIEGRDGLEFDYDDPPSVYIMRIFADGSTLIKFREPISLDLFQCVTITKKTKK